MEKQRESAPPSVLDLERPRGEVSADFEAKEQTREDKGGGRVGGERGNLPPIKRLNCAPVKLYPAQFNRLQSVRPLLKSDLRWQPPDLDSFSAQSLDPEKKSGKEDKDRSGGQFWTMGSSGRLPDNLKLGRPAQFSPLTHQNSAHSPARS